MSTIEQYLIEHGVGKLYIAAEVDEFGYMLALRDDEMSTIWAEGEFQSNSRFCNDHIIDFRKYPDDPDLIPVNTLIKLACQDMAYYEAKFGIRGVIWQEEAGEYPFEEFDKIEHELQI